MVDIMRVNGLMDVNMAKENMLCQMVKLNLDCGKMDVELNGKMIKICNKFNYDILYIHSFTFLHHMVVYHVIK